MADFLNLLLIVAGLCFFAGIAVPWYIRSWYERRR